MYAVKKENFMFEASKNHHVKRTFDVRIRNIQKASMTDVTLMYQHKHIQYIRD